MIAWNEVCDQNQVRQYCHYLVKIPQIKQLVSQQNSWKRLSSIKYFACINFNQKYGLDESQHNNWKSS